MSTLIYLLMIIVIVLYTIAMTFIFLYSLAQAHLVYLYLKYIKKEQNPLQLLENEYPMVTIQLPVYNEKYVVERLIDSTLKIEYPAEKLEIQILDDSTDETTEIIKNKIQSLQTDVSINHVRRKDRKGFKAGALAYGMKIAKGEYLAIFDADFIPNPDFLKSTLPYFKNSKVGVVQSKWEHINENFSLLTKLQAFGLDAHFTIEQSGRNKGNFFINFNGTAGIWRKSCIEDAGGWQDDTLTEDLDLSYRAQLKGWKFVYLKNLGNPAELPIAMNSLKSQQYRWTKGAAECARKNLPVFLKDKSISFLTKIHGFFHLMNSAIFISIILLSILSVPLFFIKNTYPEFGKLFKMGSFFVISLLIVSLFYLVAEISNEKKITKGVGHYLYKFPLFLAFSMGLSLHNAIAVLEGYLGKKTPFVRTPKFNVTAPTRNWKANIYLDKKIHPLSLIELFLSIYFLWGVSLAFAYHQYELLPLHLLLSFGFGIVGFYSIKHAH